MNRDEKDEKVKMSRFVPVIGDEKDESPIRTRPSSLTSSIDLSPFKPFEPAFRFFLKTALETRVRSWFTMELCLYKAGVNRQKTLHINSLQSATRYLRTPIRIVGLYAHSIQL